MLDTYCGSPFWNSSLSWDTDTPRLTPCFRHTVLVWVPCLFLWFWSSYHVYLAKSSRSKQIPWTLLNIAKFVVAGVLLALEAVYLIVLLTHSGDVVVDRLAVHALFLKCATLALSIYLDALSKNHGLRSSGVQFLFWLLLLGSQLLGLILKPESESEDQPGWRSTIEIVFTALVGLQLGLNCWADAEPIYSGAGPVEKPCPELASSFPSSLCFFWFEGLARLGHRRPLQLTDLWDLPPENASKTINPPFVSYWSRIMRGESRGAAITADASTRNGKPLSPAEVNTNAQASFKRKNSLVDLDVEYKPDLSNGPPSIDDAAPLAHAPAREPGSIIAILSRQFGPTFLFGCLLKLGQDLLAFASPFILRLLIRHTQSEEEAWRGYFYALSLLLLSVLGSLVGNAYFYRMYLIGLRVRTAVVGCVYRKALRVSSTAQETPTSTSGEVVNLMSVDAQKLTDMMPYLTIVWSAPLQIGLSLYFLHDLLGASVFAGLGVMLLLLPVSAVIGIKVKAYQSRQLKAKDRRMKLMSEILAGIKAIKLHAWEPAFEAQVTSIRDGEVRVLKESAFVSAVAMFVWTCAPVLVAIVTFAVYVLGDGEGADLDAERAFVSLSYFNIMRLPLNLLPMMLVSIAQSGVSVRRINKFLNAEEVEDVEHDVRAEEPVRIRGGSFAWRKEDTPTLRIVDLSVRQGELVAIVGRVGAGKSSLLAAVLGEIEKIAGTVNTRGSIAYTAQAPWIQNCSVRDNILFGRPFDALRYAQVLDGCALGPDLEMLPGGDATEIGEKGINLSGGQKQRVALARAAYVNADVYLLDDPLSAVDAHVGRHIFEKILGQKGMLGGACKTRLLVTHGVTHLPQVDRIVVLEGGIITEEGSYRELLDRKGAFADFLLQHLTDLTTEEVGEEEAVILADLETALGEKKEKLLRPNSTAASSTEGPPVGSGNVGGASPKSGRRQSGASQKSRGHVQEEHKTKPRSEPDDPSRLVDDEFVEEGVVKWGVFFYYLRAIGWKLVATAVVLQLVFQGFAVGSNVWLALWADSARENGTQALKKEYLCGYASFGLGQALSIIVATLAMSIGTLSASGLLHARVLRRVLRAPAWFFDTTPSGRIVNRLGKDVEVLDNAVSMSLTSWLKCLFNVAATMGIISYATPVFLLVVLPTVALYSLAQRFYIASSRQLRRLESVTRSPIYSHFAETIAGTSTIRAFGEAEAFAARSEALVDQNQAASFPSVASARFLAVLLETVGNLVIFFAALFAVASADALTPGLVGLSLSYALQVTHALNWLVETTNNVENNLVAVERLKEYSEIAQEAAWETGDESEAREHEREDGGGGAVASAANKDKDWPAWGRVVFEGYGTKYREELEPVLHDLSFEIQPGEKVGICGRTGAGKSSLVLALFRLLEPTTGRIEIDGQDISCLGLHQLRRSLTVIPQDPFVFAGTIRSNLDPLGLHSDDDLHASLARAHLRPFVKGRAGGLEAGVAEGGANLSVGQRQLLCLARALLRKSRILVLDEATAAVDLETDDLIQATIRAEFAGCTVLTIAHRLNTILDSSRLLVLDGGALRELDTPAILLSNPDSAFHALARDAGLVA